MSAKITTATVPNSLPVIELTITHNDYTTTTYPTSLDAALDSIQSLGIVEVEYDELTDTRLLHEVSLAI